MASPRDVDFTIKREIADTVASVGPTTPRDGVRGRLDRRTGVRHHLCRGDAPWGGPSLHEFDVIVIGAGPAGATAAALLAKSGRSVVLLEAAKFPRPKPSAGWVNARAAPLLDTIGVRRNEAVREVLDEVTFLSGDLSKSAKPKIKGSACLLVDRAVFDQCLVNAAVKAGADFRQEHLVTSINPLEQHVEVDVGGHTAVSGRMLLVAAGLSGTLLRQIGVQLPKEARSTWSAHLEIAKHGPGSKTSKASRMTLVLGVTPDTGFCSVIEQPDRISITLNSRGDADAIRTRLLELARGCAEKRYVSVDLTEHSDKLLCLPTFPFSALELDTHVGKHTLIIGDTGGFFASVSHEGIYPAMWSAEIAVGVVQKALDTRIAQDALTTFDTKWRLEMGEFLRPPNTDLQLLLPLIFTNQPMADRMAAAFFTGENI
jgi:flavin-dependent dehydrogenase